MAEKDWKQFAEALNSVHADLAKINKDFIGQEAERVITAIKEGDHPVDTGNMCAAWKVGEVKGDKYNAEAAILNGMEYATFINDGTSKYEGKHMFEKAYEAEQQIMERRYSDNLKKLGIYAIEAVKKPRIDESIQELSGYNIIIHKSCEAAIMEFEYYVWAADKLSGEPTNKPIDEYNHCLTGDTIVNTPDGDFKIKDLVGKTGKLFCFDEKQKKKTISDFFDVRKTQTNADIYEIELEDGTSIRATTEHPVLIQRGWMQIGNLKESDKILKINL